MKNKEGIRAVAARLAGALKDAPEGFKTTTRRLLRDTGHDVDSFDGADLMEIHSALLGEAEKEGLVLDMSSHDGKVEGLPYDLDFAVRGKEDRFAAEERKREAFVERVAEEVLGTLTQEDREYLAAHPDPFEHHFGLGMWIRNRYIHGRKLGFFVGMPDSLSGEIVERILRKLSGKE